MQEHIRGPTSVFLVLATLTPPHTRVNVMMDMNGQHHHLYAHLVWLENINQLEELRHVKPVLVRQIWK
jgi:hypothetical protein